MAPKVEWRSIKKKTVKTIMMENFVIEVKNRYNLTYDQARSILDQINHAISMKHISQDAIRIVGDKIIKIDGVAFDEQGKCHIEYDRHSCYHSKSKDTGITLDSFAEMWSKHKNSV